MARSKRHILDLLFPAALFLVMAASALLLTAAGAKFYQRQVLSQHHAGNVRTCLSYTVQKARSGEGVFLTELDGTQALAVSEEVGGTVYVTYVYRYNGSLRELFVEEGVLFPLDTGTAIASLDDFSVKDVGDGLLQVTCGKGDFTASSLVRMTDRKEEAG